MKEEALEIKAFDPSTASEAELAAFTSFDNEMLSESRPDEAPRSLTEIRQELTSIPAFIKLAAWGVWRGPKLVAEGHVTTWQAEDNRHLAEVHLAVLPEFRRRGLATELLAYLAREAVTQQRRLLIGTTDSFVPAGEAFAARLGAEPALAMRISKLEIADVDRELMRRWIRRAQERAGDFELEFWEGAYPETEYEAIADMKTVMNTAPRDELEVEDVHWTPAQLHDLEASLRARGITRWTLVARQRQDGAIAGYTDVYWDPRHPGRLDQGDTGVFPAFRNRGLGRWLKAAMMMRILADLPQVERMYTGNAHSNAPMLAINEEMGFSPYKTRTNWQVAADRVGDYLEHRAGRMPG
ncbi:MAG TPA: GNAT family N-acetyltransferase [Trueperaceae bacterium]